jgi:lysophospholipid acyltransferase (LPLAT)-like uncharacterized protein
MKKFLKTLTKTAGFQNFLSWIISLYLKLVFYTSRSDVQDQADASLNRLLKPKN